MMVRKRRRRARKKKLREAPRTDQHRSGRSMMRWRSTPNAKMKNDTRSIPSPNHNQIPPASLLPIFSLIKDQSNKKTCSFIVENTYVYVNLMPGNFCALYGWLFLLLAHLPPLFYSPLLLFVCLFVCNHVSKGYPGWSFLSNHRFSHLSLHACRLRNAFLILSCFVYDFAQSCLVHQVNRITTLLWCKRQT